MSVTPPSAADHTLTPTPNLGLMSLFSAVLKRDLQVGMRRWTDASNSALFFILVVALFPLALSPKAEVLRVIAPGVIWIAALLATLLSLHLLFRADLEDGTLEQLLTLPYPLGWILLAKTVAHWIITGIPVVVMAPILAVTYQLPASALSVLTFSLLLGTPTLSLLGSIGAAGQPAEPFLRLKLFGRNPMRELLGPGMKVRLVGTIELRGVPCDILEISGDGVRVSAWVRKDNRLIAQLATENRDARGTLVSESQQTFTYTGPPSGAFKLEGSASPLAELK